MMARLEKFALTLLIIAFCVPGLGYIAKQASGQNVSVSEQRRLTPFPDFTLPVEDWTSALDEHLEDSFGFRMSLIRLARRVRDNLGENPPLVAYGSEDWLFINETLMLDEFRGFGPWNSAKVERWIARFTDINQRLAAQDIPFVALIAPDKARIYPEHTPQNWTQGRRRFKHALDTHPGAVDAGLINIEPELLKQKAQGHHIYFKRDTHWTPDGYVPVAQIIMNRLDPQGYRARTMRTERTLWSPQIVRDLDGLLGNAERREPHFPSIRPRMVPGYKVETVSPDAPEGAALDEFPTLIVSEPNAVGEGTLVVVGDSFADSLLPELSASYSRVVRLYHGVDRYRVSLDHIMAWDPVAVLFIAVERNAIRMDAPFAEVENE